MDVEKVIFQHGKHNNSTSRKVGTSPVTSISDTKYNPHCFTQFVEDESRNYSPVQRSEKKILKLNKPESINDKKVPSVLLSGDHQEVSRWRRKQSLGITWKIRPDLLKNVKLGIEDDKLLKEYIAEIKKNENK